MSHHSPIPVNIPVILFQVSVRGVIKSTPSHHSPIPVNIPVIASQESDANPLILSQPIIATIPAPIPTNTAAMPANGARIPAPMPAASPMSIVSKLGNIFANASLTKFPNASPMVPSPSISPPNNPSVFIVCFLPSSPIISFSPPKSASFKPNSWKSDRNFLIASVISFNPSLNASLLIKSCNPTASSLNADVIVSRTPLLINASNNAPLNCLTVSPNVFSPSFLFASSAAASCIFLNSSSV